MDNRDRQLSDISCSTFDGVVDPFPRASITQMCNICGHLSLYSEYAGVACTNCNAGAMIASKHSRDRSQGVVKGPTLKVPTAHNHHRHHNKPNNVTAHRNRLRQQNINTLIHIKTKKQTTKNPQKISKALAKSNTTQTKNPCYKSKLKKKLKNKSNRQKSPTPHNKSNGGKPQGKRGDDLQKSIADILGKGKKQKEVQKNPTLDKRNPTDDASRIHIKSTKKHTPNTATHSNKSSHLSRKQQKLNALGPMKHVTYRQLKKSPLKYNTAITRKRNMNHNQMDAKIQRKSNKNTAPKASQNANINNKKVQQKNTKTHTLASKLGKAPPKHNASNAMQPRANHVFVNKNKSRHHKTSSTPLTPFVAERRRQFECNQASHRVKKYEEELNKIGKTTNHKALPPLAERVGTPQLKKAHTTKHIVMRHQIPSPPQFNRTQTDIQHRPLPTHKKPHHQWTRHKKSQSAINSTFHLRI